MDQTLLLSLVFNLIFGTLTVIFSFKEEKTRKYSKKQSQELSRRLYEISVLNRVQEDIGYSLNVRKVAETILSNLEDLLPHSTVSYAVIEEGKIIFKTHIEEPVGGVFLYNVKNLALSALSNIDESTKNLQIVESLEGSVSAENKLTPLSYFNVPLVVNNKLMGIINISSKDKSVYQEEDMSILYKIINQAERAVEKLEAIIETEKGKLNSMLKSIPYGAVLFLFEDQSLKASFVNKAAIEFLKTKDEPNTIDIISKFGSSIDLIEELKNVLKKRTPLVFDDIVIHEKYFKVTLSPVFLFENNNIMGVSITMQDMTLEKQIQKLHEDFTNMVVHELRAPLTSIKGAAELLSGKNLAKEESEKMLSVIKTSSERMLMDISDLLDAAKIDSGKFSINKTSSDIAELIKDRVGAFSFVAEGKAISIQTKIESDIPLFDFDKDRIGQVLNNLLSNSIKFTHTGGRIDVWAAQEDGQLKVFVKDNGIGISKEKQSKLFAKYTQVPDLFSKGGTGLGLYISKGIVESHNGKIWLDSDEGRGTTVYFTIPIVNPKEKTASNISSISPERVLN